MNRAEMLCHAADHRDPWDVVVVGGGATGAGVAVDAASRGYTVLLLERHDFGKGTSSRSTKLVHGGVRYLGQGNFPLVREALRDATCSSATLHTLPTIEPSSCLPTPAGTAPFYGIGLTLYNILSGRASLGPMRVLTRAATLRHLPTLRAEGLRGGVLYHDGQFDDARLLINLLATAAEQGATLLNYAPVTGLTRRPAGTVDGVIIRDLENDTEFRAAARVVVNATGVFCDAVRRLADPASPPLVTPSQGTHLVFDRSLLPGDTARPGATDRRWPSAIRHSVARSNPRRHDGCGSRRRPAGTAGDRCGD